MVSNVVALVPQRIEELSMQEVEYVNGGNRISNAAAGIATGVLTLWTAAFTVGYSIGKDIGEAIFGEDKD